MSKGESDKSGQRGIRRADSVGLCRPMHSFGSSLSELECHRRALSNREMNLTLVLKGDIGSYVENKLCM